MITPTLMLARLKQLLFQNRGTKQTVAKNVFWLSISEIMSRAFRAIVIIYAARILGAEGYGVFSYALGLAGFFTIFLDVGLTAILTREVAQRPEKKSEFFATVFWIKSVPLVLTTLVVVFVAPFFSNIEAARPLIPLIAFLVFFDAIREFTLGYLRARERMEIQALITTITNVSITIFGFVILYFVGTSKALTITYALSAGTGAIASILAVKGEFLHVIKNFNKNLVRSIISAAWPMAFTALLGAFMLNTDIIMLGWFKDAAEVGLYSAGQKIVLMLYVLPTIFTTSVFPALSRLVGQNERGKVRELIEKSMAAINSIAIPLSIGGIILGGSLIEFLYGAEFIAATITFQILMLTILFTYAGGFIGNLILAYNMQGRITYYWGIASASNFILNALLIPPFGAAGAAVATVIAQLLVNYFGWHIIKKVSNFYILRYLTKIIPAAMFMGVISLLLDTQGVNVLINVFISAGLYWLTLYILKESLVTEILNLVKRI